MKNKEYFIAVKVLFYGIMVVNLLLIFISINKSGMVFLIFSQFTFLLFICTSWILLKKTFNEFFTEMSVMMEKMIDRDFFPADDYIDDTYPSQIHHQMGRLYDILQDQQKSIEREKNKVQSFVSDISHQLKTPLTNMHLLLEAIKRPDIYMEEHRNYLDKQEKQLDKIDFLIGALLKASQLENGLIQISPRKASISNTILSALEGILAFAEKKEIDVYYDNTIDYIVCHDPKWTEEALFNVMENAVKYTQRNGKLMIRLNETEKYVAVSIKDNGIGISRADQPHIFERFWRGNTNVSEGNGIGLYLCRQIITLQQGYVLVNSAIDSGSEFVIFLPL